MLEDPLSILVAALYALCFHVAVTGVIWGLNKLLELLEKKSWLQSENADVIREYLKSLHLSTCAFEQAADFKDLDIIGFLIFQIAVLEIANVATPKAKANFGKLTWQKPKNVWKPVIAQLIGTACAYKFAVFLWWLAAFITSENHGISVLNVCFGKESDHAIFVILLIEVPAIFYLTMLSSLVNVNVVPNHMQQDTFFARFKEFLRIHLPITLTAVCMGGELKLLGVNTVNPTVTLGRYGYCSNISPWFTLLHVIVVGTVTCYGWELGKQYSLLWISPKNFAIGIDIGTMNGRVSVFRDGKVEIIPHGTDLRAIPCCVAFTDTNEHIGNDAKKLAETNPENVIFNVKRFIGREFHETSVQNDIKRVPFHVKDDKNGRPQIQVAVNGKMKGYYPEKLSSMVFDQMKKRAGTHLNCSVKDAVITVPAYFTDFQRQATKNAATSAGLNVLRIINEPTAAAIAYGLDIKDKRTILFFDLGAGAFDASIITCDNGTIEVKATVGDSHYGSEDFDNRIVNHFVNEFENTHEKDLASNPRALSRLRVAAELAKHTLSSETVADVNIESLFEDTDFNTSLSRDQFELICADLFQKPKKQLRALLVDAEMKSADIDEIVTIGCGSLPKIDDLIKEVFTGISINKPINHEELVVCGAAIQAAVLSGVEVDGFKKVSDILNFTLGVKSPGSRFIRLIERKTRIPVQVAMKFHPEVDYQPFLTITVLEEHGVPQKVLGDINYALIPQTPRVVPRVEVIFEVDADGVLVVSLRDVITRVLTSVSTRFKDHSVIEEEGQAAEPVQ